MEKIWTIIDLIRWSTEYFANRQIATPRLDAELLLAHTLGIDRTRLYVEYDRPLNAGELSRYRNSASRRVNCEPVAYITGEKEFWSLKFKVNPHVLIPRPETEILLETILQKRNTSAPKAPFILDIGTGSGNLAVSLATEFKRSQLAASDLSEAALEIARENAQTHGVSERISWYCGNLFDCLEDIKGQVDLLISNPPYITEEEMNRLQPEVRDFEPHQALTAGPDGLDVYKNIIAKAGDWLNKKGLICLEIGHQQAGAVVEMLQASGHFSHIQITKDYAGLDRVVSAQCI